MGMGPNAWSTLGSGLLNIGDKAVNFAQLWNSETDRQLRREREQKQFDAWKKEQGWKDEDRKKAAAAEQANKDYNKDVASAYEPVTKTRTETEEYQEPGQGLTLEQNNALAAKHGLLNPKDFSSGLATQERLNNQNKAAELRNAQFEFNKQRFGEQHALELEKFLFDQEHKGLILNEQQRTHKANEWLRSRGLDIQEKKAAQPSKGDVKDEKQKEKETPFLEAAKFADGTPTGNQAAVNRLYTAYSARTPQQQLNILQSVVSDSFLESQRKQGQGFLTSLQNKLINGDKETLNMFYNNIDTNKLRKLILTNVTDKDLLDEYQQHLIAQIKVEKK